MAAHFTKLFRDNRWKIFFLFLFVSVNSHGQTTLYTYQSGAWDNPDVWTTDPGGTTLVGSKIPGNGDAVVVLTSRTLILNGHIASTGLSVTIREGGIFDASSYRFTGGLASLEGQGTYRLKSEYFPVATVNNLVNAEGGTVEYYNDSDFTFPPAQTIYNDLRINCAGFTATQLNDITINGSLRIQSGSFRINDGTSARRSLVVYGNLIIDAGAWLTTGTGNTATTSDPSATGTGGTAPFIDYYTAQSHRIEVFGDFTNNGTVRFTNQAYPVFNAFPADGFASVFFRGTGNNTLTCNGQTDFYNLIVDKGTDQTFILTVNSAGYDKFRIYGANVAGEFDSPDAGNPNIRKALWIRNGTLRLNGFVFIPSLVESAASGSGDFIIPENGAVIIDGPDVVVMGTIDDYSVVNLAYGVSGGTGPVNGISTEPSDFPSALALYGKLQINGGYFYIGEIGRVIYHGTSAAQFIINGGTIDIKQFQSVSGGGKTAFWQTGGDLILRGRFKRNLQYTSLSEMIASIGDPVRLNTARATSGGGIPLGTDPTVGTLNLDQDANIFHMEGGTIGIYDVSGSTVPSRALEINADPSNVSVTGGTISIFITGGSVLPDQDYGVASKAPLFNLTLSRNSGTRSTVLLAIPGKTGVTPISNPPLIVLNDLILSNSTVSANAVLNSSDLDVKTGGNFTIGNNAVYTPGTNHTILNGSGAQVFSNNGTITSGLFRFVIDKISGTATLGTNISVRDSLAIFNGTLNDGGYILQVAGNIYNAGIHSGTGTIVLNGSATQTLSASPGGTSILGNIDLQNPTNPAGVQLESDVSLQSLSLTANAGGRSVLDIKTYNLNVAGGTITSSGSLQFGSTKMVRVSGNSSDKGLTQYIALTGSYTNQLIATFPLGVGSTYYPALIYCDGNPGTVTGTFTVTPVNSVHPATNPGSLSDALPFYWKTRSTGFSGLIAAAIDYHFYHSSINPPMNKSWCLGQSSWVEGSGASGGNARFDGIGFSNGDFTAGKNNPFRNPTTFYSRQSGAFNDRATWSTNPLLKHTGAAATSDPQPYDMIVIGGQSGPLTSPRTTANDSITVTGVVNVASITINGSYTGNDRLPVLNIQSTTGHTIDIIRGNGKFCSSTETIPISDYGELLNSETAFFHFYGGSYTLPAAITTYPNLLITGNNTKYFNTSTVIIRKNLMIADGTLQGNVLSLNNASGNLTIFGDIKFKNGGKLIVPSSVVSRNIDIYGSIDFTYGNSLNVNAIEAVSGAGTVHKLNFHGSNIYSGASNLIFNPANTNKIDLYFTDSGKTLISNGTGTFSLNRLFIQKNVVADTVYFKNNFTLNETGNASAAKSLNLNSGTLVLSDPANGISSTINLNLTSGGTNYFIINSSSKLILRNGSRINISGNTSGSGILLDGVLQSEDSQINLADGSSSNTGYIEYSGSGNATINLSGSSVLNAAQIRRSLLLTTGLLKYTQSGSSIVTVYGTGAIDIIDPSRAKLEITGTGSSFNMSGTASISIINGAGTTFGDLYLRPEVSQVTGGEIIFGTGTEGQSYKIDATVPLNSLTINAQGAANELQIMINPLELNGNLVLTHANSTLTTNSINLTLRGNFTNNGIYNAGSNNTIISGNTQSIGGNNDPLFWNLTSNPSAKLVLGRDVTVNNALNIVSGILEATTFNLTVKGNVANNGAFTNSPAPSTSRLYLNGISVQNIAGTGSFGRIELDNNSGIRLGSNLILSEDLTLTNGILDINQFSLTLGPDSYLAASTFDVNRMIKSDGVFSNGGVTKNFNSGYAGSFVYPLGVDGKYTPATLTINSTTSGWVRLNIINARHPATLSPFNVLNYYWECESGISGFDGNLSLRYSAADVTGDESQYVAGRLIIPPGTGWSKAAAGPTTDNVDETTHSAIFNFPSGTANLGGQYTAGSTLCLPNIIPVYRSRVASGNWDNPGSWTPSAPAGGPNGFAVIIEPGHTIYTNGNRRFSFRTTINGTLDIGTTYGHNLGTVDGNGRLALQLANLPAGDFSSFIGCSGGTLEYGGTESYTIVADRIDTVRNLLFTGTGTRTLPDKDLVICNQLQINGPALDNHFNRKLTIGGSFDLTAGTFVCGTGESATVTFKGSSPQTITGFNGSSPLNNLEISNNAGLTLNSAIEINGNLLLTNGLINTSAANILRMISQSGTTTTGSSSSFVNGPMSKNQIGGIEFFFPVGKANRYGQVDLLNPQTGIWEAEYFNTGYSDPTFISPLTQASSTEYWRIKSPANGKTATVRLRWDSQNEITPVTTLGGMTDIRFAEYNSSGWIEKPSVATGNDTDGTVKTLSNIVINNTGHPQYFTLGSVTKLKPTILPGIIEAVCRCMTVAYVQYISTTGNPDQYTIDFDATANAAGFADISWTALPESPIVISVPYGVAPGIFHAALSVRASSPVNQSAPYSISISVIPDFGWTGSMSTDWNLAVNWSCGSLPGPATSVQILDVPNKPVLSTGATGTVNNLIINAGSSVIISGNTLKISGSINNNGTFTATNGIIEMNGTAAQVIGTNVFSSNTIRELVVNNNAGVALQGPLNITGNVRIQSGTFESGGNLTLVSTATGTAFINGSGTGEVTGIVTMQRYLPSGFGYKYFSSPFQAATVGEFSDDMNLAAPLSFHRYNENRLVAGFPASGWELYNNPAAILAPVSGYSINFGSSSLPLTVDVAGVVNNGNLSVTLYNNNQIYTKGMNLVGNPYPSPIDWTGPGWTKTNIDNALYFFKASTTDQYGGTYSSWINGISSDGVASNIIPSMQGFFVHVTSGSYPVTGTLAMNNNVRVTDMTPTFISKSGSKGETSLLRLTAGFSNDPSSEDPLVIYLDDNATPIFDSQMDAIKFFNTDYNVPNFFSSATDGSRMSVNAMPFPKAEIQPIPLGIKTRKNGEIIFRLKDLNGSFPASIVYLYDDVTGSSTDLTIEDYSITLNAGDHYTRFFLKFADISTDVHIPSGKPLSIYASGNMLYADINCLTGKEGILKVHSLTGQTMLIREIYENGHHEFTLPVVNGIYIVSFVAENIRISQKIIIQN